MNFMDGDFVGFDMLDTYDPTTKLLGSLAKSQYPYTLYPVTNTNTNTANTSLAFFTPTSIKPSTLATHPWSDMVFDDMCPMGLSPGISSALSTTSSTRSSFTSSSSASPLSPTIQTSTGDFRLDVSRSRTSSTSTPSPVDPCTHEYNILDIPTTTKKDNSELSLPQSIAPNCLDGVFRPRHDSLLDLTMSLDDFDPTNGFEQGFGDHQCHQDIGDQDMDVDSNGSVVNDNDDTSSKSSPFSRDSSTISDVTGSSSLSSRSPELKEATSRFDEKTSPPKIKSKAKSKSKSKAKSTKARSTTTSTSTSTSTSTLGRPTKAARKQSGAEQLSPEAKRQRFLERNRLAAAKCREKKRLQTLKTITDADEITAKNQALHESLNELQEEVRMLKNQILCHRDCGCDVIQKFVKTSLTIPLTSSSQRKMSLGNPPFSPPYFHDG
ncbi:hypothetical protein BGZ93_001224 [Podila epicladia]|nr:hypothetical protein BGZ93_001224 [Podila epicladia]